MAAMLLMGGGHELGHYVVDGWVSASRDWA